MVSWVHWSTLSKLINYCLIRVSLSLVVRLNLRAVVESVSHSWLARCVEVVDRKLKVVMRPVRVVQYWRQPFGGLKVVMKGLLPLLFLYTCSKPRGGHHSTCFPPSSPGFESPHSPNKFRGKIINTAEVNQCRWLEENWLWDENVDRPHLFLSSGKVIEASLAIMNSNAKVLVVFHITGSRPTSQLQHN